MKNRVLATRYARALAHSLETQEEFALAAAELETLAELFASDSLLRATIESPAVALERRATVVREIARAAGLSGKTERLLSLLEEHGRIGLIGDIAGAFRMIRDERQGVVEAELTTAVPLDDDLTRRWEAALSGVTGKKVKLKRNVDPGIIGGAVARVGSVVYDSSLRSQLARLRRRLAEQ